MSNAHICQSDNSAGICYICGVSMFATVHSFTPNKQPASEAKKSAQEAGLTTWPMTDQAAAYISGYEAALTSQAPCTHPVEKCGPECTEIKDDCTGNEDGQKQDEPVWNDEWSAEYVTELQAKLEAAEKQRKWTLEETDSGFRLCKGEHHRSTDHEWTEYVPAERIKELEREVERLKNERR